MSKCQCISCGRTLLPRIGKRKADRRKALLEGTLERKYVEIQIFPEQVPIDALVCYACWMMARRHSQRIPELTMEIEVVAMCATCLSPNPSIEITELKTKEKSYKDIFAFCLDLEVTENLETQKLCQDCYSSLLSFNEFKTQALKNYAYLKAIPKPAVSPKILQENDGKNEINPLGDIDDHIGDDESNNEIEIRTEDDIKQELLIEPLENESECHEEYLSEEKLDEKCIDQDNKSDCHEEYLDEEYLDDNILFVDIKAQESEKASTQRPKDICRKCGNCVWDITGHLQSHIPKSERSRSECDYCNKTYARKKDVRRHIKWMHSGKQRKKSICKICNKEFSGVDYLKMHKLKVHSKDNSLQCGSCHRWFLSKKGLRKHKMTFCPKFEEKKKCQTCGMAVWRMKEHLRTHLPKSEQTRVVCDVCHKDYSCKISLQIHIKKDHSENSMLETCDICLKEFYDLEGHKLRTHFKEKLPFKCPECPQRFLKEGQLRIHTRLKCGLLKCGRAKCDICHK